MNKKLLMILIAGVDIWAALLITQIRRPLANWEVSLATSDSSQAIMPTNTPVQIWIRSGQTGIWPDTAEPIGVDELCRRLESMAKRTTDPIEVRLLCDPSVALSEWGSIAVRLAKHADELKVAPLPE